MTDERHPQVPRIPPLPEGEWSDDVREMLSAGVPGTRPSSASKFLTTLVRFPGLYRRYAPLGGRLLGKGALPAWDRELVCLRITWLTGGAYAWGEHVTIAHRIGFSTQQIENVIVGAGHPDWSPPQAAVLRAVDELRDTGTVSDSTWDGLAQQWDERQLIEFPILVAHYQGVAYVQNMLRVGLEDGNAGLAAR